MWLEVSSYEYFIWKISTFFLDSEVLEVPVAFVEDNATMCSIRYFENHICFS